MKKADLNANIMNDVELKLFLKKINVDVLRLDHAYRPGTGTLACITCDYVLVRCWLCDQCLYCCKENTKNI